MCPEVSRLNVHRPTLQPRRAAACAASIPACPAPITITSNFATPCSVWLYADLKQGPRATENDTTPPGRTLLTDAEAFEDVREQIVRRAAADDLVEAVPRRLKIGEDKLLRRLGTRGDVGGLEMRARRLQ
jgi:hypothetical protein